MYIFTFIDWWWDALESGASRNYVYLGKYLDVKLNLFTDDDCGTVKSSEYRMIMMSRMFIYALIYLLLIKMEE